MKCEQPFTAQPENLEGLAADLQLLLAGHNLHDAYQALMPALVNWCCLACETKEEAAEIAMTTAVNLINRVELSFDSAKREHAETHVQPNTKSN